MSRKTRVRRLARRAKPPKHIHVPEATEPWGSEVGAFTPGDWSRVLSRYRNMRGQGGVRLNLVPLFDTIFKARNPEELNAAVGQKLLVDSKGKLEN
jgi:hypothetical protein